MPPLIVENLAVEMGVDTATVSFSVPVLIHGSETYRASYGTTADALDLASEFVTIASEGDHSITISGLLPGTTYYFQLSGVNDIGTTLSGIIPNTTLEAGNKIYNGILCITNTVTIPPPQHLVDRLRT